MFRPTENSIVVVNVTGKRPTGRVQNGRVQTGNGQETFRQLAPRLEYVGRPA